MIHLVVRITLAAEAASAFTAHDGDLGKVRAVAGGARPGRGHVARGVLADSKCSVDGLSQSGTALRQDWQRSDRVTSLAGHR